MNIGKKNKGNYKFIQRNPSQHELKKDMIREASAFLEALERIHAVLVKHVTGPSLVDTTGAQVAVASASPARGLLLRDCWWRVCWHGRWWYVENAVLDCRVDEGLHADRSHGVKKVERI